MNIKLSLKSVKNQWFINLLLLISMNVMAADSDYFVTTWSTTGASNTVTIPTKTGAIYDYAVDWNNDGVFDDFNITGDATHDYASGLTIKTIRIAGTFPRIFVNNGVYKSQILSIEQWGTNPWSSMKFAFYGANNLVNNATDIPDLSAVDTLHMMFHSATNIGTGSGVWNWNTTGVTKMSSMFQNTSFNKYIGSWDTSAVTTFNQMFSFATLYDKNINNWNVEAATDFTDMFLAVTLSTSNYEGLLISWANQNINNALSLELNFSKYCSQEARTARNSLIFSDGLSISDAGLCEEGYFITTWKTDNQGTSSSTSITIPTEDSEIYNYQVDWNGDGDFNDADENNNYTSNATHDYGVAGTYTVKIKGIFPRIFFDDSGDKEKILSIEQWGTKAWSSMHGAFMGTNYLKLNALDTPDLSEATNLVLMFALTSELGLSTGNWEWDTSNISNIASAFTSSGFDFDISSWNVQNVTNFTSLFHSSSLSTSNYDKLLETWWTQSLISNVNFGAANTQFCSQSAQDGRAYIIANYNWTFTDAGLDPDCDTSIAENHFVISVNTENTGSSGPASFTIPTTDSGYNYSIDANNDGTFEFTGITGNFTINFVAAGIKTIGIIGDFPRIYFNEGGDKDKILSVEQWGTNQWSSMNNAFSGASNLVINANDTPNLSNATSLFKMFAGATNLGNGSGNWDWDTSTILGFSQLFKDAVAFDKDISSWDVENVNNFGAMFTGATLSSHNYDALLLSWNSQNLNPNMAFNGGNSQYCSQAAINARGNIITNDGWTISDGGYNSSCGGIDDMANHFVFTVDTENTGTSGPNSFTIPTNSLFTYNYSVDWNNDGVFDVSGRDEDTTINYDNPGIKIIRIFGDFPAIYFNFAGDNDKIISIDQWGSNQWSNMGGAFGGASNLVNNALDVPDLSICFNLNSVFKDAESIGQGTANWNWDTSNVTSLLSAFNGATSFNENISFWNIEAVNFTDNLFEGVTLSSVNYDALLIGWESQTVNSGMTFSGGLSKYCSQDAEDARQRLIDNDSWTIIDGGIDPSCLDDDIIFTNGFEDIIATRTSLGQITYDFSKIKVHELIKGEPMLIISGYDINAKEDMQIHVRNDFGLLQIRLNFKFNNQWQLGQWQNISNQGVTTLHWEK